MRGGIDNPALCAQAFDRGNAQVGAGERLDMTVAGIYAKTGILLIVLIAVPAFGWSRVAFISVSGREVAQQPWTLLAFLLTFILRIAAAFAVRAAAILGPFYALSESALPGIASHYFDPVCDGITKATSPLALGVIALWIRCGELRVGWPSAGGRSGNGGCGE